MTFTTEIISVRLKQPFTTARDRTVESQSAIIRIEHDGVVGIGEAKMTADSCGGVAEPVADYGDRARAILGNDPFQLERILDELERVLPDCCIKLMKCGGLREALRMIHVARALGMQVMLGCMVETSLSLTAAAHLLPLADYSDLDSAFLLERDPFAGFTVRNGTNVLPDGPGLGVTER